MKNGTNNFYEDSKPLKIVAVHAITHKPQLKPFNVGFFCGLWGGDNIFYLIFYFNSKENLRQFVKKVF